MWYYKGSWCTERPENLYTIVHYYNENNWLIPYIYYYTDNNNPISWPGNAMVSEGGNWYTFTIPDLANPKVIFSNNGSNQNPAQNQPSFDVSGEKWYLNGTFYDSEPEGITVHYHNYDNWSNVNIYYYDGERTGNNWTGNPMISDGDGWYTYKIYGFDSVKVLFNNGGNIQIPGQYEPGFYVSGEMWYRNGEWTTERPDGITVYFYKPENWGQPDIYYYKDDNDTGPAWPGEQMRSEGDNWYSFTITKYDEAKVLFNSISNQIPAQNQPGLDATGVMWYNDGVWCDSENDSDNDDLPDFMEMILGTNLNSADSDGDGLPDGLEVLILGTDPLKTDSDENGVNDGAEDADNDGLTNLQEYTLGTDPNSADSDGDGLNDGDEVTIYHTDPLLMDTDGDGLSDYNEIQKGFNPLVFNADFDIILSYEGSDVTASVNIDGLTGEQAESLSIEPVDNYVLLDDRIPGYIDCAFNFSVSGSFDTAIISFEFDESLLNDEDFVPRIYYFNEQTQVLEELQNQTLQGNVISVETSHFSKYILLNKTDFDSVWDSEIKPPNYSSDYSGIDIVFVIDSSGSMTTNDSGNIRLSAAKAFVDKLGSNDRAAVIDFDTTATLLSSFTSSHSTLYSAINQVDSSGGTSLTAGISMAITQFTDSSYTRTDAYKYIIFLTDGDGDYSSSCTTLASNNNITIYSIGLGSGVNSSLLCSIATGTGGRYYYASTATTLPDIYDDIAVDTIDYTKDSNNDGISDYYTKLISEGRCISGTGINFFNGVSYSALQANDDYDGDGIKNGDEAIVSLRGDGLVYIYFRSDPCSIDSDNDGYLDSEDKEIFIDNTYNFILEKSYGFSFDESNLIIKTCNLINEKYRNILDTKGYINKLSGLLAVLCLNYDGYRWQMTTNVPPAKSASDDLMRLGLTLDEITDLIIILNLQHGNSIESLTKMHYDVSSSNFASKTHDEYIELCTKYPKDFVHELIQLACFSNEDNMGYSRSIVDVINMDEHGNCYTNYECSFKGDVDSTRYDNGDFASDIDAINIYYRTLENGNDVFENIINYNADVIYNVSNMSEEFLMNLGQGNVSVGFYEVLLILSAETTGSNYIREDHDEAELNKAFHDFIAFVLNEYGESFP